MSVLQVVAAGFSPVKGTRHLPQPSVRLESGGPVGDRTYCLVDVAARRVLRTVQNPSLMSVVARLDGDGLTVTLPSGESVTGAANATGETLTCDYWGRPTPLRLTSGGHAELFSAHLGRDVRLVAAPPGAVVFGGPVTLVATASLDDLASRVSHPVEPARFRPTLVIGTDEPYEEETWLGREITAGGVRLRVGVPVPRCAVIDHEPTSGIKDASLLKTLATHRPLNRAREPAFGVYAQVLTPGEIAP